MKKKYYLYEIDINVLNIGCILLLILFGGIGLIIYPKSFYDILNNYSFLWFMIVYFGYMILHELFHSLAYVIYGADFKNITYGICLEKGVLCCLCKQNVSKNNILHSLMYPLLFIGVVTFIVAYILKMPLLFILSILNLSGCAGDIVMFLFIKKLDDDIEFSEIDNPVAFALYSKKDLSNETHFGLKYMGTSSKIERNDFRKVYISKMSIIFFVVLLLLGCIINFI